MAILFGCHGKILNQEICEATAGKEDPIKEQQGKKPLSHTSRERNPFCTPAVKEDPVEHQQRKKTLLCISGSDNVQLKYLFYHHFFTFSLKMRALQVPVFWQDK